jgi:hypothetical protein
MSSCVFIVCDDAGMYCPRLSFPRSRLGEEALEHAALRAPPSQVHDVLSLRRFASPIPPAIQPPPCQAPPMQLNLGIKTQVVLSAYHMEKPELPCLRVLLSPSRQLLQVLMPARRHGIMTIVARRQRESGTGSGNHYTFAKKRKQLLFSEKDLGEAFVPALFESRSSRTRIATDREREVREQDAQRMAEPRRAVKVFGRSAKGLDQMVAAAALGQWINEGVSNGIKRACLLENENLQFFMARGPSRGTGDRLDEETDKGKTHADREDSKVGISSTDSNVSS